MTKSKWSPYFLKALWSAGLILLAIFSFEYENKAQQTISLVHYIWTKLLISFVFGLYISTLFVKKWSFKINPSLLICVTVPCLLLSVAYPIWSTQEFNVSPTIVVLLMKIFSSGILGTITGLTVVLGVFSNHIDRENQ